MVERLCTWMKMIDMRGIKRIREEAFTKSIKRKSNLATIYLKTKGWKMIIANYKLMNKDIRIVQTFYIFSLKPKKKLNIIHTKAIN